MSHFPLSIEVLFNIRELKMVESYCDNVVLDKSELAAAIASCAQKGYLHDIQTYEWVPEHLQMGPNDMEELSRNEKGDLSEKGKKVVNKISHIFIERTALTSHLFIKKDLLTRGIKWHVFYFDYRDLEDDERNHWKQGRHIHFVNCLRKDLQWETVWRSLAQKGHPSYGPHLRFEDGRQENPSVPKGEVDE
jgi:hypothetical protein